MPVTLRPVEAEVEYMEDLDVGFISLVDKGANRVPFKIIKSEDAMDDVIQSVITPVSKSIDDYKESFNWVGDFKVAKTENHGDYTKYVSFPMSDLQEDSYKLVRLSEDADSFAIIGKPKTPQETHIVYKASVMDVPIRLGEHGIETFGDEFYCELSYLIDSLAGTMSLGSLDNKKKKMAIANALDAFKIFISAGLDMNSGQTTVALREYSKFEKRNIGSEVIDMSEVTNVDVEKGDALATQPGMNQGVPDPQPISFKEIQDQVFKSQEEMTNLINSLAQKFEALANSLAEKVCGPASDDEETEKAESNDEMSGKGIPSGAEGISTPMPNLDPFANLHKMEEMITKVVNKVEKLEEIVEKIDGDVPESSARVETVAKVEPGNSNPFTGIFSNIKR